MESKLLRTALDTVLMEVMENPTPEALTRFIVITDGLLEALDKEDSND